MQNGFWGIFSSLLHFLNKYYASFLFCLKNERNTFQWIFLKCQQAEENSPCGEDFVFGKLQLFRGRQKQMKVFKWFLAINMQQQAQFDVLRVSQWERVFPLNNALNFLRRNAFMFTYMLPFFACSMFN